MRAMGIYSDALNGFSHPINSIPVDDWIISFFYVMLQVLNFVEKNKFYCYHRGMIMNKIYFCHVFHHAHRASCY